MFFPFDPIAKISTPFLFFNSFHFNMRQSTADLCLFLCMRVWVCCASLKETENKNSIELVKESSDADTHTRPTEILQLRKKKHQATL